MADFKALLDAAPLGDRQRNHRAAILLAHLLKGDTGDSGGPATVGSSVPWAHSVGAFRFWNNPKVSLRGLYEPCRAALAQIIPRGARCYVAHDFSVLDYSGHLAKADRVRVGDAFGLGYDLYSALVIDAQGRPRGPVLQELRSEQGVWSSEADAPLPFVDHLGQADRGVEVIRKRLPDREVVHIYDAEFDDIALQRNLHRGEHDDHSIIRAQHMGRQVLHEGKRCTLEQAVETITLKRMGRLPVRTPQGEVAHTQWVGETSVVFDGLSYRGRHRPGFKKRPGEPLTVRVVVSELRAPGHKTLRWVLLTTQSDEAVAVARAYYWRWRVERLFYFLKVGFRLESWRQESSAAIARRLALTSLAAMALYQLQALAEGKTAAAKEARDTMKWVATRGGWLGRKRDPLGPVVLMRGMRVVIAALSLLEQDGIEELLARADTLRTLLGGAIPDFRGTLGEGV